MSNSNVMPTSTGGHLWLELKSGFVYCFLPSGKTKGGQIHVYSQKPKLLDAYIFFWEIQHVSIYKEEEVCSLEKADKSEMSFQDKALNEVGEEYKSIPIHMT